MRDVAIVLSDCQGPAIAWVLSQLSPLVGLYEFKYFENWQKPGPLASIPADTLERCKLMFYQVADPSATGDVLAQVPSGCHVVRFGSAAFAALYPRRGRWPRDAEGRPRCALHPELADKLAIALVKSGVDKETYLSEYFSRPIANECSMEELFEQDRVRLERSDHDIDIKIADYILSNVQARKLFHCIDHPTNDLYLYQMREMIDACRLRGVPGFEDAPALKAGLLDVERTGPAAFGATEFFGSVQTPVHPDVAEALGLRYCGADTVYENDGLGSWTHRGYIAAIHDHMTA